MTQAYHTLLSTSTLPWTALPQGEEHAGEEDEEEHAPEGGDYDLVSGMQRLGWGWALKVTQQRRWGHSRHSRHAAWLPASDARCRQAPSSS